MPHNLSADEFFAGISKPRNLALMKIFSDLDIVDYTGHGVPTIVDYYGKDIFNIQENFLTADKLALIVKKSKRTIERYLKALQEKRIFRKKRC